MKEFRDIIDEGRVKNKIGNAEAFPISLQIILSVILILVGYLEKGNWTESKFSTTGYITLLTFILSFIYENYNKTYILLMFETEIKCAI